MATDVGSLAIRLGMVWDKRAEAGANAKLDKFSKGAGAKMGRLAGALTSRFAALAGVTAAVFATRDAAKFSESMARLSITAKGGLGTLAEMQDKILQVSSATGVAKEEVLGATSKFIELTGNVAEGGRQMALFAKVAQATGANTDDVAGSAAAMSEQFNVSGADFEKMFSVLIEGGKAGSAEFKDMAGHLAGIGAASQKFANSEGIGAAAEIGAALQIVSKSTGGNVAEAGTQIKALFTGLGQASKKLKKHGVNVFDTSGEYRELSTIMGELKSKGLSAKELESVFPNVRAQRGVLALLRDDWDGLTKATLASNAVSEDYKKISQNSAIKLAKAWNKFKNVMTGVFVVIVDTMSWLVDHSLPVSIAIASIAAALLVLKVNMVLTQIAAVGLGNTMLVTWLKALAPVILIALAIAAIILVVQDLWTAFNGGESVFGDLHEWAVDATVGMIEEFAAFFNWVGDKFDELSDKAASVLEDVIGIIPGMDEMHKLQPKSKAEADASNRARFGADFARKSIEASNFATAVASGEKRAPGAPTVSAGSGRTPVSTSLTVNIEAGANVDDATITKLTDQTQATMDRTSRQLASESQ